MKYRDIFIFGEPVLREKSKPVSKFDSKLSKLIKKMHKTMKNADGVGLAAPQVGHLLRVVTVDVGEGLIALVNPEIIDKSKERCEFDEGCLSFPGVTIDITRPEEIRVAYLDEKGNKNVLDADGLLARVIQHEIDHLDGVLIIDKADNKEKLKALEDLSAFFEEKEVPSGRE